MAVAERNGRARRSRFVPMCAIGTLLALACLNPLPDDFPNDRSEERDVDSADGRPASPVDDGSQPGGVVGEGDGQSPAPEPGDGADAGAGSGGAADAGNPGFGCDAGAEAADAGAEVAADAGRCQELP